MAWFRFYDDAMLHPKILALRGSQFRMWLELLCLCSRTKSDGYLPDLAIIGKLMGSKRATIEHQMSSLIALGLVDNEQGRLRLHNWEKHQYKSDVSTERTRRYKAKRNGEGTFPGTAPEQSRTDTEQKDEKKRKKDGADRPLGNVSSAPPSAPNGAAFVGTIARADPKTDLYRRGDEVLGPGSGGMVTNLLKAKGGSIAQARAAIEQASEKHDPKSYIAAIIRNKDPPRDEYRDGRI